MLKWIKRHWQRIQGIDPEIDLSDFLLGIFLGLVAGICLMGIINALT